jgi:hypothetical protein
MCSTSVRFAFGIPEDDAWPAAITDGTNAEPKRPASIAAVVTAVKTFRVIDTIVSSMLLPRSQKVLSYAA